MGERQNLSVTIIRCVWHLKIC